MLYEDCTVVVSGGFDPVHIGHVRMFQAAKNLVGANGKLIIVLNCDKWLERKKGRAFMKQDERAELISAFECVDSVFIHESDSDDVCGALEKIKPDIFANGGDRCDEKDIPEARTCKEYSIDMVFNVGHGGKVQSSSWLLKDYENSVD